MAEDAIPSLCAGLVREYLFRNGYDDVLKLFDEETVRDFWLSRCRFANCQRPSYALAPGARCIFLRSQRERML